MTNRAAVFSADTMHRARARAALEGRTVLQVLEDDEQADSLVVVSMLAATLGYQVLSMSELRAASPAFDLVPFKDMLGRGCILQRDERGILRLVVHDPFDVDLQSWMDMTTGGGWRLFLAQRADIAAWHASHEENLKTMDGALSATEGSTDQAGIVEELSFRGIAEDKSPVVRLVNSTIFDALRADASDIHLESLGSGMAIKYRLDGVLSAVGSVPSVQLAEQVISRIKVMSELDIAERRIPQDGRFRVSVAGREVDLRVSIMPSIHGEDAVLRILDKRSLGDQVQGLRLTGLGFSDDTAAVLRRLAALPYGMMLVTGPTGSGKTTTLYAAISEINHGDDKIITIEDPVEYQLPGVLQIPVNERKGLTFARGLRSILRHDPDKIMVGEIRDPETAQIAIQSALTGHLVFTTVHANNVFDVLGRFTHMGVDPYAFVSALNGILAQRLVRTNCPQCSEIIVPTAELLDESGLGHADVSDFRFMAGRGCGQCRGTGYKGRKAIAEILGLNDEIRELIVDRAPIRTIKEAAIRHGTRFLRDAALDLVKGGLTTLAEINRVTLVS